VSSAAGAWGTAYPESAVLQGNPGLGVGQRVAGGLRSADERLDGDPLGRRTMGHCAVHAPLPGCASPLDLHRKAP